MPTNQRRSPRSQRGQHPRRDRRRVAGREIGHSKGLTASGALRGADVLHQLPRPHRHRLRRPQRHERGPRAERRAVRLRVGRVLHRLHPARSALEPRAAQVRRAPLALAHHGELGHRRAAVHLGAELRAARHPAIPSGRRRSRLLPRRDPVPEPLGALAVPRPHPHALLLGPAAHDRHRRSPGRLADPAGRGVLRPRRLAVHVLRRRHSRDHRRRHRLVLPEGQAERRQVADPRGADLAHRGERR